MSGLRNQAKPVSPDREPRLAPPIMAAPPIRRRSVPVLHDSTRPNWAAEYDDNWDSECDSDCGSDEAETFFGLEDLAGAMADAVDAEVEKDADWVPGRVRQAQRDLNRGVHSLQCMLHR